MEREILFRGKRADNGEWVEGCFVKYQPCASEDKCIVGIVPEYASALYIIEVIPETVGRYTGLTDKNGVKIFEGDIVNVKTINGSFINYVITWFNSDLCWTIQSLKDTSVRFGLRSCWEFEVVDNIHDNPELLNLPDRKYISEGLTTRIKSSL